MTEPGTNHPDRWQFVLSQARQNGDALVVVAGRLSAAVAPRLASVLADAVAAGDRRIVLDLRGLDYISSAGILALEVAAARLRTDGGELVLCGPTPPVRLALDLSGFPDDVRVISEM